MKAKFSGMSIYRDPKQSVEKRVRDLLGRMSAEEKIGQLCKLDGFRSYERRGDDISLKREFVESFSRVPIGSMYGLLRADWWSGRSWSTGLTPSLMERAVCLFQKHVIEHSRWGIPLLLAEEAPHGLMALGGTVFPTGLGLGATWNPDLLKKIGEVIGAEGGTAGIHTVYGPILDLARDPRWSRVEEDFSEDPTLAAHMGRAYVEGLQGGIFPKPNRPFATVKHFAAHGDPEGGHNSAPVHLGPVELRNIQLKPFAAAIKAGAQSVMCAYHSVDGIPCAANQHLLGDILRGELGFNGFVVSDRGAIPNLKHHRFVLDDAEACAKALKAGIDTDEGCIDFYSRGLREALDRGLITMEDLDRAVARVLSIKFRMGLFENPYPKQGEVAQVIGCAKHRRVALEAARQSITLLSNSAATLPLEGVKKIAVIGPNADTPMNQLGDYTAPQNRCDVVTVLEGMRELGAKRGIQVQYGKGCKIRSLRGDWLKEALTVASEADVVVLVLGGSSAADSESGFLENGAARVKEVELDSEFDKESGEGYDRANLRLGGLQLELLRQLRSQGKRLVTVLIMGRPLIVDEVLDYSDAVLLAWYPGMEGGRAVAEAIFGEINPAGRLPVSFPRSEAQLPVFYNTHLPRHNYIDHTGAARLSFGFGLSYSTFSYGMPQLDKASAAPGETVTVSVDVKNTSQRTGDEVVQLYLTVFGGSVARPFRQLVTFQRISLKAGESRRIVFSLGMNEMGVNNAQQRFVVEPGKYVVGVGGCLDSLQEVEFHIK
ncbi:MAG: hypothetical protein B9S32_14695 [Verrucomicrobia bacterium Tous-C9LFEB]|nr:MAG: hypothetical protein B9S32_14695 [Verrucomicrobia bacterium Tous-C9LFEB]